MKLSQLVSYLNEYLQIGAVPDYKVALNGLQLTGRTNVERVAIAVDACKATIQQAVEANADVLLVHHGLFWSSSAPITGPYYDRISLAIKNDLAVYSCHLPLDVHPEVGNNHVLARLLGLEPSGLFGEFEGTLIGVIARTEIGLETIVARVRASLHVDPYVIAAGPEQVRSVGILTGGGGSYIADAAAAGIDTLLTGEGAHHTYFDAEERGLNVIYAGHYATETVGVQALGDHLARQFGLETVFLDHPTGL